MNSLLTTVNEIASPVYLVGGSVRDILLKRKPKDYDFCTPLLPDDIEARVRASGRRAYTIGKRFGTIGCKIDGQFVEITTFRQESYTPDSRRPHIEFVDELAADLVRRDFTINAIALDTTNITNYIDPFGGIQDIEHRVIRAVGVAHDRLREDPLRMLRAARFASKLDFVIDDELLAAMTKKSHRILTVSKERWMSELDKLLISEYPAKGLRYLADTGILKYILPELALQIDYDQNSPYHSLTLWEHSLKTLENVQQDIDLRWAALLHDIGKPAARVRNDKGYCNYMMHDRIGAEIVEGMAYRLKWSNARRKKVTELVLNHLQDDSPLREADNGAK